MLDVPSLGGPLQRGRALRKLRSHWSPLMWKMCLLTHLRKCTQTIKGLHNGNVYWCRCPVWESAVLTRPKFQITPTIPLMRPVTLYHPLCSAWNRNHLKKINHKFIVLWGFFWEGGGSHQWSLFHMFFCGEIMEERWTRLQVYTLKQSTAGYRITTLCCS